MIVDDQLRPAGRARRAEDAGQIGSVVTLRDTAGRNAARHGAEERVLRVAAARLGRKISKPHKRLAPKQRVAVKVLVNERERR